jgi:dTDP-4-amino-4,6-dideoxygalactose transaminase
MKIAYSEALQSARGNPYSRQTVIPINRLETHNWDLLAALASIPGTDPLAELREVLQRLTGRQHIYFTVVKTAVEIAGKRILYVDLGRNSINASSVEYAEAAKPGRILLVTHLFGIPTDIEAICELARNQNCVTIEDAAACIGANRNGRPLGTFADYGIFSFERSKRFPAFRGGVVVVNNEQPFDPAKLATNHVVKTERAMPARELMFSMLYNIGTIPWFFGRVALPRILRGYADSNGDADAPPSLPAGGKATEASEPSYTRAFHPYQARLVLRMLRRMDSVRGQIARLVSIYLEAFRDGPIMTFMPPGCDQAGLLRFPIACAGRQRAEILRLALGQGVYPEVNFDLPLPEKSEYSHFPNAVWAACNLMELPLYSALSPRAAERLAHTIAEIGRQAARV